VRSSLGEKRPQSKKKKKKVQWLVAKKKDCDEPHLALNEKIQPIQWTKRPIGALVVVGSLWPDCSMVSRGSYSQNNFGL
jgi:hypothetical protein